MEGILVKDGANLPLLLNLGYCGYTLSLQSGPWGSPPSLLQIRLRVRTTKRFALLKSLRICALLGSTSLNGGMLGNYSRTLIQEKSPQHWLLAEALCVMSKSQPDPSHQSPDSDRPNFASGMSIDQWLENLRRADRSFYNMMALEVWSIAKTMDDLVPGFWNRFMENRQVALKQFMQQKHAQRHSESDPTPPTPADVVDDRAIS